MLMAKSYLSMISHVLENVLDDKDNIIKELYTDVDGAKHNVDYAYGADGLLIKETYTDPEGGKNFVDYTYDADGNVIKTQNTYADGKQTTVSKTYDARGNVVKEEYSDSDGNRKTTKTEYVFVYIPYDLTYATKSLIESATEITWADD